MVTTGAELERELLTIRFESMTSAPVACGPVQCPSAPWTALAISGESWSICSARPCIFEAISDGAGIDRAWRGGAGVRAGRGGGRLPARRPGRLPRGLDLAIDSDLPGSPVR